MEIVEEFEKYGEEFRITSEWVHYEENWDGTHDHDDEYTLYRRNHRAKDGEDEWIKIHSWIR